MTCTRFDPDLDLIIVQARLWGPLTDTILRMAVDTGASDTMITPDVLDALGYNPRDAEAVTSVTSVVGIEKGYRRRVEIFSALGFQLHDFLIHVHDLPDSAGLDGLLGLNFLKHFNYEIRSREGLLVVDPI